MTKPTEIQYPALSKDTICELKIFIDEMIKDMLKNEKEMMNYQQRTFYPDDTYFPVPVRIVRRSSNYRTGKSHFEVALTPKIGEGALGVIYQSAMLVKVDDINQKNSYEKVPSSKVIKFKKPRKEIPKSEIINREANASVTFFL